MIDALTPRQVGQLEAIARRVVGVAAPYTAELLDEGLAALPDANAAGTAFRRHRVAEAMLGD